MTLKTPEQLEEYVNAPSSFVDFSRFEDAAPKRRAAKRAFLDHKVYAPQYEYPKLDHFYDVDATGESIADKKRAILEAIYELEAHRGTGVVSDAEIDLNASFHENRLKKIMLVESARRLHYAGSSNQYLVAREEFTSLNKELYGEMDSEAFDSMMRTEQERIEGFGPANDRAAHIKEYLHRYFMNHEVGGASPEEPLISSELMAKMQKVIAERYANVLAAVPDTDDDVYYDAQQCREIMQHALEANGFAAKGWVIEVNPAKSNPVTSGDVKKIYLPVDTKRNASQLRRLTIHEIEVHARRGQNGEETGVRALGKGTADYADVEEGLGVLLECVVAGDLDNQSFHRARDRYITAGLALGTDGTPKDGPQTFELLWRLLAIRNSKDGVIDEAAEQKAMDQAMVHIENAFRGTNFAMTGIIYTKLKVYYEGLAKNARFFAEADDLNATLDMAMIGKYNHVDPSESETVQELVALKAA